MFDHIVLVRIIAMQNEADRRRWRKDEDAFYRDFGHAFGYRFLRLWRYVRTAAIRPDATSDVVAKADVACGEYRR